MIRLAPLLLFAAPAAAQSDVHVYAELVVPVATCSAQAVLSSLDFGTTSRPWPATNPGTVHVDAVTGVRTGTGGVGLIGTAGRAEINVDVSHASSYTVAYTAPADDQLTGEADTTNTMLVAVEWAFRPKDSDDGTPTLHSPTTYTGSGDGRRSKLFQRFLFGGTVTVDKDQPYDSYSGTIEVSVTCT